MGKSPPPAWHLCGLAHVAPPVILWQPEDILRFLFPVLRFLRFLWFSRPKKSLWNLILLLFFGSVKFLIIVRVHHELAMIVVSKCQWLKNKVVDVWFRQFLILEFKTTSLSTGPWLIKLLEGSFVPPDLELGKTSTVSFPCTCREFAFLHKYFPNLEQC